MTVISLSKLGIEITKDLWDSHGRKCVISLDKYNKIPDIFKTDLFESNITIKAANGSSIENSGKYDITFRIGTEKFTFPFLASNTLRKEVILGYNFSRAFHFGMHWNKYD